MDPANTPLVTGDDSMSARQPVSDNAAPSANHLSPTAHLFKMQAADEQDCCTATSEAGFDCTSLVEKKLSRPTNTDFDETAHASSCAVCAGLRADKSEPASPTSDTSSTPVASSQMDASSSCGTSPISERFQHPQEPQAVALDDHPTRAGQTACKCHHGIRHQSNEQVEAPPAHRITKSSVPTKVAAKQDPAASRVPNRTKYSVPSNTASEMQMPLPEVGHTSACQYHLSRRVPHNDSMRSTGPACSTHSPEPGREDICQCSGSKCSSRKKQLSVPGKHRPANSSLTDRTVKQLRSVWSEVADVVQPVRVWRYCVGVMRTAIGLLIFPLGLLLALFALLYIYRLWLSAAEVVVVRTIGMVCSLPLVGLFRFCPQIETKPNRYVTKVIAQDVELVSMQNMASDAAALPYQLYAGQAEFMAILHELAALDLPSRDRLVPMMRTFNRLSDQAAQRITDTLAMTNSLIDGTILANSWASNKLRLIVKRENSLLAPMHSIPKVFGVKSASERELGFVFSGLTMKLSRRTQTVLGQHQQLSATLVQLKNLLDDLAIGFLEAGEVVEEEKLDEEAYWKHILRAHQHKMRDWDKKTKLCARFCDYTKKAGKLIGATTLSLQAIGGNLKVLKEELDETPALLASDEASLELTIASIAKSVELLEKSRTHSESRQKARVERFERSTIERKAQAPDV
ncbi:unnamed protein product [Zymoseptoria tritici ST99CH_3D7]|uniref:Uncharacterized protein n=1 Tax=Zymoseptoria tritici (strain ST99CH_3D7) TaxID=1276538 RepID=A0A1X7S426_ZYMT9|nr:unnamed protein product [Zymoseptoria tritici ST99CH_3D7]